MQWELIIYDEDTCNHYVDMKVFNDPKEISDMLKKYEGYWCRIIDLTSLEILLEGAFDSDYLDKGYYEQGAVSEEEWKSIMKNIPSWALSDEIGIDNESTYILDLTSQRNYEITNGFLEKIHFANDDIRKYKYIRKKVIIEIDSLHNPSWYYIHGDIDEYLGRVRAALERHMK